MKTFIKKKYCIFLRVRQLFEIKFLLVFHFLADIPANISYFCWLALKINHTLGETVLYGRGRRLFIKIFSSCLLFSTGFCVRLVEGKYKHPLGKTHIKKSGFFSGRTTKDLTPPPNGLVIHATRTSKNIHRQNWVYTCENLD